MSLVLGIDPGFASIGYALVRLKSEPTGAGAGVFEEPVDMGLIRTGKWKKASKPRKGQPLPPPVKKPSVSEDNLRRAQAIADELEGVLTGVSAICVEAMSYPRNASAAAKMAMCWGVIAALAHILEVPVVQVTPKELKKAVCGLPDAEKREVQIALDVRYGPDVLRELVKGVPRSMWEHPYDALGAVYASQRLRLLADLPRE